MSLTIPALGTLIDDYLGTPAVVRWLSIHPAGRVVVRESANMIAFSVRYQMWVQPSLVRDVYRLVDLRSLGSDLAATLIPCGERGVVMTARLDHGPVNPVPRPCSRRSASSTRRTARWRGWPQPTR